MAECSIVKLKDIEEKFRLDSEYYKPFFLEVERTLNSVNTKKLEQIKERIKSSAFYGSISFYYSKEKGTPFVRVSDIDEPFLKTDGLLRLPEEKARNEKGLSSVSSDYLLVSKGGSTGNFCIIPPELKKVYISRDVIGIKINDKEVEKYYLLIFFLTKFGKAQLLRGISRQTLPHITLKTLQEVKVAILDETFQTRIKELVTTATEKRILAEKKYAEAESLLFTILHLEKRLLEKLEERITYKSNIQTVRGAFRFDADYYHPKYTETVNMVLSCPFPVETLVKARVTISNRMFDPTRDPHKTTRFRYVPIAKMNESGEIYDWDEFYGWEAPSRARMVLKKNDVLIPSLSGTHGKIAIVPEELDGQLGTTGCFVVNSSIFSSEFLFLYFRSLLFKRQLEQCTTGGIMSATPRSAFRQLLIPMVPYNEQNRIANLVKEYFGLMRQSREIIKTAILITEKGIQNASRYTFN